MLGTLIGVIALFLLVLAFALCAIAKRDDEHLEIIERRIRDISPLEPDHPGTIVPFQRRS